MATSAIAATLGTFKLTGQVTGTVTATAMVKGADGLTGYGCQLEQGAPVSENVFLPVSKLSLNGHSTTLTAIEVTVGVASDGAGEHINRTSDPNAVVELALNVGTRTYLWTATSGTVSLKAKGDGGSFTADLVPSGSLPGGTPLQSGGATKPLQMSGSWSSCHPFPQ
jgi:hypothetical protein